MLGWLLGALFTVAGPIAMKARAFVPGLNIMHWLKVGLYLSCLALGLWGGVVMHNWWTGPLLTETAAIEKCDMKIAEAEVAAKRAALDAREQALRDREQVVLTDEERIASQLLAMKEVRDASAKVAATSVVCVPGDDTWLRAWQGRGVDGAGRRRPGAAAVSGR